MPVVFRIEDHAEIGEWMRAGIKKGLEQGLYSTALRTVGVIVNELIPAEQPQPVDIGAYRAGWRPEKTRTGADVVNDMPYAPIIEYGARPENIKVGRAMIRALSEWVVRKGLVGRRGSGGAERIAKGDEAQAMAWGIAMAAKKRGFFNRDGNKGLRIGEKAIKRLKEFASEEIQREIKHELSKRA